MTQTSAETLADARRLYEDGDSLGSIAKALDVHRSTVNRWAKRDGWRRPPNFHDADPTNQRLRSARRKARLSWAEYCTAHLVKATALVDLSYERLYEAVTQGRYKDARVLMTIWGTSIDKAEILARFADQDVPTDPEAQDPDQLERSITDFLTNLEPPE